nr:uncharacterized protein LOC101246546 [Solanum lycopersicum]
MAVISDGGSHFCNKLFKVLLEIYGVCHNVATPYHPQTSWQKEVSNRDIKQIFAKTVNASRTNLSKRLYLGLPDSIQTPIGMSLYQLVFGKACPLPFELELKTMWAMKKLKMNWNKVAEQRLNGLYKLDEFSLRPYESSAIYKEKMKKFYLFLGKFKSKCTCPYLNTQLFPHGEVELDKKKGFRFKVNRKRIKIYPGHAETANESLQETNWLIGFAGAVNALQTEALALFTAYNSQ